MNIGEDLRILRERAGMTQERWGEVFGFSTKAVYKHETGECLPEEQKMLEIIQFTGANYMAFKYLHCKSVIARKYVGCSNKKELATAALSAMKEVADVVNDQPDLIDIARDNAVTPDEYERRDELVTNIDEAIAELTALKCALCCSSEIKTS